MVDVNSNGTSQLVKDHAAAFSAQSKFSNRLWITLIALIFVVVLPAVPAGSSSCPVSYRNLAFGIGCTDPVLFDLISFFMLAVVTIAFCGAQAQAIRGYRRAQDDIDKMRERTTDQVARQREFFDSLAIPSLSRVGSLPVLILAIFRRSVILNILASIYYFSLKFLAVSVHIGIPIYALGSTWWTLHGNESVPWGLQWIGTAIGVVTLVALAQILLMELFHIGRTLGKFMKGEIDPIKVH